MSWKTYVNGLVGDEVNRTAAHRIGVTEPTLSRWRKGQIMNPDAQQAAALARAYRRPVLEAFIAAGYLTSEEAGERPTAAPSLSQLTDDALLAEVRARMSRQERDGDDAAPTNQAPLTAVPAIGEDEDIPPPADMAAYDVAPERPYDSQLPEHDDDEGR